MSLHSYSVRFYRLSVDGFEGSATNAGLEIMKAGVVNYRGETWAIANAIEVNDKFNVTAALLTRSRKLAIMDLRKSDQGVFLEPQNQGTYDFVPMVFYHGAHAFAIPEHQRLRPNSVMGVLRKAAGTVLGDVTILPLLSEDSIVDRLRSFSRIIELTIKIVRENPESDDDKKLLTDDLEKSHVQRELLRLIGDPRGLNIDGKLIRQHLKYITEGFGELKGGKAVNRSGNIERISGGAEDAPFKLDVRSTDQPDDFARRLVEKDAIPRSGERQLNAGDEDGERS
jgi:hypothetical protein